MQKPRTALVDTHCHLQRYPVAKDVWTEAQTPGAVVDIHAVTCSLAEYREARIQFADWTGVRCSLGMLPQDILQIADTLDEWLEHLPTTRLVGEIGLDYVTKDEDERALQRRVFERILNACAAFGDKVLTIHSRRAAEDVLDRIAGFPGTAIMHWYSGPIEPAAEAASNGVFFSFNPAMMSRSCRRLLEAIPPERVLLETDGPFVHFSDRAARPSDLRHVVNWLGQAWGVPAEEAAKRVARASTRVCNGGATTNES